MDPRADYSMHYAASMHWTHTRTHPLRRKPSFLASTQEISDAPTETSPPPLTGADLMFRFLYDDGGLQFYRSVRAAARLSRTAEKKTRTVTPANDVTIRAGFEARPPSSYDRKTPDGTGGVRRRRKYKLRGGTTAL